MLRPTVAIVSFGIALLMTVAVDASVGRAQAETDLEVTFGELVDAVNAGDVDAALALFTDDATWVRGGRCPVGACVGLAAIRTELEKDVADNHHIQIVETEVAGSTLTARVELRTDGTRAAGLERIIHVFTLEFQGDRISALQARPDLTDPETASLAGGPLPAAGSGPPASHRTVAWLFALLASLAGTSMLAAGFALRTRTR